LRSAPPPHSHLPAFPTRRSSDLGDCDDGDRSVHPGAPEIPDDGIDQNCVGGDASSSWQAEDPAFVEPPATVPKDFKVLLLTIDRSEEHTSELQSRGHLVCRLLLE